MSDNGFNRRQFLGRAGGSVVGAGVLASAAGNAAPATGEDERKRGSSTPSLFDKIYGCLAGTSPHTPESQPRTIRRKYGFGCLFARERRLARPSQLPPGAGATLRGGRRP